MESIRQTIADIDPELVMLDPAQDYDRCVIGIARRIGQEDCVAYDMECVIDALVESGMDHDEAEEFFEFNIECAYLGPGTPLILHRPEPD